MLSWLLGEPRAEDVREALAGAELVLASNLTLVECDRALIRAAAFGLDERTALERSDQLARSAEHWVLLEVDGEIVERARRPFPAEPVRTLDALHLATALAAKALVPEMAMLSLDDRLRRSAALLGLPLLPERIAGGGA